MRILSDHGPHLPEGVSSYLGGDPFLTDRLGGMGGDSSATAKALDAFRSVNYSRKRLAEILVETTTSLGGGLRSIENARAVAEEDVFVVATGQQPGLLTGPLYTLLKAASAIAVARRLEKEHGVRFIPLFWVASDDHDLDEMRGCALLNDHAEVQRFRLNLAPAGAPASMVCVPAEAEGLFSRFIDAVPDGSSREDLRDLATPRVGEPWANWFGRILLGLFRESGLVLFDPAQARDLLEPHLERELQQPSRFPQALADGAQKLREAGLEATLPTEAPSCVFYLEGTKRRRFRPGESPTDLASLLPQTSPDAGLRAVLQSLVLPAPVCVVGPGELTYWSQLREAFELLASPRPVLVPRIHATFVEPRVARALNALGKGEEGLFVDHITPPAVDGEEDLTRNADIAFQAFEKFADSVRLAADPAPKSLAELERAYRSSLDRVVHQTQERERERRGISRKQIALVTESARPGGKPQERVLCGLPFLARAGLDFYDTFAREVDPFTPSHRIIHLENGRKNNG